MQDYVSRSISFSAQSFRRYGELFISLIHGSKATFSMMQRTVSKSDIYQCCHDFMLVIPGEKG